MMQFARGPAGGWEVPRTIRGACAGSTPRAYHHCLREHPCWAHFPRTISEPSPRGWTRRPGTRALVVARFTMRCAVLLPASLVPGYRGTAVPCAVPCHYTQYRSSASFDNPLVAPRSRLKGLRQPYITARIRSRLAAENSAELVWFSSHMCKQTLFEKSRSRSRIRRLVLLISWQHLCSATVWMRKGKTIVGVHNGSAQVPRQSRANSLPGG
jgi:hypothetical protein